MKTSIVKMLLLAPVLLFLDWVLMIVLGCISCSCGANCDFYTTIYLYSGIALLLLTFLLLVFIVVKQTYHPKIDV